MMGKLYLIPTPIGNLEDITLRALRILKEVDVVLAEDTRTTGVLLKHYDLSCKLLSHHKFNEHSSAKHLVERLQKGETMALVSDAGTPGISDPGFLLTRSCIEAGVTVEALPGATAFTPALVASGLPSDRFCFEGFLPQKKGRQTLLTRLQEEERTMIFYESPHRLVKTLQQMVTYFGKERKAVAVRELTKLYEEYKRGSIEELLVHFEEIPPKGEFVLLVEGRSLKQKKKSQSYSAKEQE